MDKYSSMTELMDQTTENEDWEVKLDDQGSQILVSAVHGGGIEPATSELSQLIAEKGQYNWFSFYGLRSKGNNELHVTSTNYDEKQLMSLLKNSEYHLTIHGCNGSEPSVYLGGKDEALRDSIADALKARGFDIELASKKYQGVQSDNVTNLSSRGMGVQLELTTALRQSFFKDNNYKRSNRENKDTWTEEMEKFAEAIVEGIQQNNG